MNALSKKLISKLQVFFIVFILPALVFADGTGNLNNEESSSGQNGVSAEFSKLKNPLEGTVDTIPAFIKQLLDIVVLIGVPIVAVMIIISGLRLITAQGNPEKLTKAKQGLLWTFVGAAIVLGAYALSQAIGATVGELTGNA